MDVRDLVLTALASGYCTLWGRLARLQGVLLIRVPPQCGGVWLPLESSTLLKKSPSPDFCTLSYSKEALGMRRENMVVWLQCQNVKNIVCSLQSLMTNCDEQVWHKGGSHTQQAVERIFQSGIRRGCKTLIRCYTSWSKQEVFFCVFFVLWEVIGFCMALKQSSLCSLVQPHIYENIWDTKFPPM